METMDESQTATDAEVSGYPALRAAIVVSRQIIADYAMPLRHLLAGLADESVPVAVVCPPECDVGAIIPPGVQLIRHPAVDLPLMKYHNRNILLEQLQARQVNIIHCLCENGAALVRWVSRHLAIPYVLSVDSLPLRWSRLSMSSRRCAGVIVPAKSIADAFAKAHPRFADRIEQINPGIFVDDATVCFDNPDRISGIVVAHQLNSVACLEPILGALRHLAVDGREFVVVLFGAGGAERQVWKRLSELGMLQTVTIVPRADMPHSVLKAADVFVMPRPQSAFNPLLLEAMSIGAAVAGCRGGVDDLVIDGKTAVTFDPDDELSIYNCLRGLFDKKEQTRQLAKSAQQYVRENHKVSRMFSATLRVYADSVEWFKR